MCVYTYIYIYTYVYIYIYIYIYVFRGRLQNPTLPWPGGSQSPGTLRGNPLSNTTRLTHVFFKVANNAQQIQLAVLDK